MLLEYFKGKRVVVLGASGLIGSYALKLLCEAETLRLTAVVHSRPMSIDGGYWIHAADLQNPHEVRGAVADHDVVINCAGYTGGVGSAALDPLSPCGPATALACNVIHACHQAKARLGFLSSTTVYAPSETPVTEDVLGGDPYPLYAGISESKRFLEKLCSFYHEKSGLEVAVVRPSGAYGRFDNFDQ